MNFRLCAKLHCGTRALGPLAMACKSCRAAKSRCDKPNPTGPCSRCSLLSKECSPPDQSLAKTTWSGKRNERRLNSAGGNWCVGCGSSSPSESSPSSTAPLSTSSSSSSSSVLLRRHYLVSDWFLCNACCTLTTASTVAYLRCDGKLHEHILLLLFIRETASV